MADNSKPVATQNPAAKNAKPAFIKEKGRGTVKSVPSGDTIVVLHLDKTQQGPPVERQITIGSIQAPMLARKKPEKKTQEKMDDEPFAWASREFLRKKVIGKQVTYTVEFKTPTGKEFGTITFTNAQGEQENIATLIVASGWAKVKKPNNPGKDGSYKPEIQELITLEEAAQKEEKGIWNTHPADVENSRRPNIESNPASVYEQNKGKSLTGVVEYVRTGTSLRVVLLPSFNEINLFLSGAQAPEQTQSGEFEPFGREAKFFTEHHILNRDVTVILEGIDRYNCYGSVSFMSHNLAEELLKNGLAKFVDWSASRTAFADKLKAASALAKENRVRVWANFTEQKQVATKQEDKAAVKVGKEIHGKVIEVLNGGTIVVQESSGNEYKINLSSIKVSKLVAPLLKKDDDKKEGKKNDEAIERAYAIEAKDYLRRRLIGQKVRCAFDYTRPPPPASAQPNRPNLKPLSEADRSFYSVYLDKNNVAVELVESGLAQPSEHRGGELRSKDYELILMAEDRAKKLTKGVWGPKEKARVFYVTDISQLDAGKQRQHLPFLQRASRQRAVVEYEFTASRFKVFVPKESAYIVFGLVAVRAPQKSDEYYKQALQFAKENVHQRDVEIEVLTQDKGGSFLGNLWVNKKNFATSLLEAGLGETVSSIDTSEHRSEYLTAEESAKRLKKNIWKDYDPKVEQERFKKEREEREESRKPKHEFIDVVVTEILDGSRFYVQVAGNDAEQLEELMKNLSVETSDEPHKPLIGELVKAQFTADDAWYRGKVLAITPEGEYDILYVDFGNAETLPASRLRSLDASFKDLPHQAQEASLAFVKTPELDEDYGQEAAIFLRDMVMGKTMVANLEYKDGSRWFLSLGDRESQVMVNAAILRAGLGRVDYDKRQRHAHALIEKLKEEEDKAKKSHAYIWEYGDPGFDDVDEDKPVAKAPAKTKKDSKN